MSRREPWTLSIKKTPTRSSRKLLKIGSEASSEILRLIPSPKKDTKYRRPWRRKRLEKAEDCKHRGVASEVDELEQPRGVDSPSAKTTLEVILAKLPSPWRCDWRAWLQRRNSVIARLAPFSPGIDFNSFCNRVDELALRNPSHEKPLCTRAS